MDFGIPVALVSVLGLVLLVVLVGLIIASRYRVAGPNEASVPLVEAKPVSGVR